MDINFNFDMVYTRLIELLMVFSLMNWTVWVKNEINKDYIKKLRNPQLL